MSSVSEAFSIDEVINVSLKSFIKFQVGEKRLKALQSIPKLHRNE